MLCTAETDALCAKLHSIRSVLRRIRIGAYLESAVLVRPIHDPSEIAADGSFHGSDVAFINLASGAVQRNIVTLVEYFSAKLKYFILFIDGDVAAAGNTCRTHTAGNHCRVGGHTASYGKDAFRRMHAFDILRRCLQSHEHDSLALFMRRLRLFRRKIHLTCRSAGRCGKRLSNYLPRLKRVGIKGRMQKLVQRLGLDTKHRLLGCNLSFIHQIAGNL